MGSARFERLPLDLQSLDRWVGWRIETRRDRTSVPKPTKVPYSPSTGKKASVSDDSTWASFELAVKTAERGQFDGIGFVFTANDPFTGVDLDKCRNPETGEVEPWASEIVAQLCTYTEVSPSGTGLHAIVRAVLPIRGRRRGRIEMYDRARFFCMTGQVLVGSDACIESRQDEIDALHAQIFSGPGPHQNGNHKAAVGFTTHFLDDDVLLARARDAKNADRFRALFDHGDFAGYDSQSEADLALCSHLLYWSNGDPIQSDRLFRTSKLMRPKWEERHFADGRTYGEVTIEKAMAAGAPRPSRNGSRPETEPESAPTAYEDIESPKTDLANARRLVRISDGTLRYCHPAKSWFLWDGVHWASDRTDAVERLAKRTVRSIYQEAMKGIGSSGVAQDLGPWAVKSGSAERIAAMTRLARSEPGIPVLYEEFDQDIYAFNVSNGVINLRTGELRLHRRSDLIAQLSPIHYDPDAKCPLWNAFLDRIFPDSKDLIPFLQRVAGWSLTGDIAERRFLICLGRGSNGKSTFLNTLRAVSGTYGQQANFDTFLAQRGDRRVRDDLAHLRAARFVAAVEAPPGKNLDTALIKQITGGEAIRTRHLFGTEFEFVPRIHLWLAANHEPRVKDGTDSIWDRMLKVPFAVRIEGKAVDRDLPKKLLCELPGILAWCVAGAVAWHRDGLRPPATVLQATQDYRDSEDALSGFLEALCYRSADGVVQLKSLRGSYQSWCSSEGEEPLGTRNFSDALREHGFRIAKSNGSRLVYGLDWSSNRPPSPDAHSAESAVSDPSTATSSISPYKESFPYSDRNVPFGTEEDEASDNDNYDVGF